MDYLDSTPMHSICDQSLYKTLCVEEDFWKGDEIGPSSMMKMFDIVAEPISFDVDQLPENRDDNYAGNSLNDQEVDNYVKQPILLNNTENKPTFASPNGSPKIPQATTKRYRKHLLSMKQIIQITNTIVPKLTVIKPAQLKRKEVAIESPPPEKTVESPKIKKKRTSFQRTPVTKEAKKEMIKWLLEHEAHPYPPRSVKQAFCTKHNMEFDQVERFLINTRMRLL